MAVISEPAVAGGISFGLTDEQKALRELAHDFAEKEIRPRAAEYDEHQTHPADIVAKAHEIGLMNPHIPAEYGGAELPGFEGILISEELCWGCAGVGTTLIANPLDKMVRRATDTSAGAIQDVKAPVGNRLGEEGEGFKIAMQTLDFTRPGTAAGAVGVARAAYESAVDYARERIQFGQPIAMNQGVNFLIADMATEVEAARLLVWQAAWMVDQGYGRKATLYSSFAKRFAADTAMK